MCNTVSHVWTLICWCEEITSNPLAQIIKQRCDSAQKHWREVNLEPNVLSQYLQTQAPVSPIKIYFNLLYATMNPHQCRKSGEDLLLSRQANKSENQPLTKLKPRISANTKVTSENVKICTRTLLFYPNLCGLHEMI